MTPPGEFDDMYDHDTEAMDTWFYLALKYLPQPGDDNFNYSLKMFCAWSEGSTAIGNTP